MDNRQNLHPMVGAQIGPFTVQSFLGQGAMGDVFKALQLSVDRSVALKLLSPKLVADELCLKRFEREAKALARLNHPNIVATYDYGRTDSGQTFIVMEYVEGQTLHNEMKKEVFLPIERALNIFCQIASAMHFAHKEGVIHRDLKPQNVMLTTIPTSDHVKVLDFGLAKIPEEQQKLTQPGEVFGSPLYMSPEQCEGKELDGRTDIYSLGVIMYQVLTGTAPINGKSFHELLTNKFRGSYPKFNDLVPELNLPKEIETLIQSCLHADRAKRIGSMAELKDKLEYLRQQFGQTSPSTAGSTNVDKKARSMGMPAAPNRKSDKSKSGSSRKSAKSKRTDDKDSDSKLKRAIPWVLVAILTTALMAGVAIMVLNAPPKTQQQQVKANKNPDNRDQDSKETKKGNQIRSTKNNLQEELIKAKEAAVVRTKDSSNATKQNQSVRTNSAGPSQVRSATTGNHTVSKHKSKNGSHTTVRSATGTTNTTPTRLPSRHHLRPKTGEDHWYNYQERFPKD